ncbi:MAG TPA: DnaJ C-terminal domain-containing protein [Segeticoccus sp.]|uniref:DnaJ C-terminal domain-containing protein n=1 Tax=Segeticoccus sp. TaxID=2706531 RepID=UPI002D80BC83|nr:DnaJ C-terminal domain-containing protein [Segeticoccus sp.]HET8600002.1 DnaJ C-terminal domain-containing protein [Segeticoccus sp.]
MASQDWFEKDFYQVLGVSPDVDDKTLKKTYRKLAREWHPDAKPGDASAEQRFKEIGEAYAVLSDPEQRRQYDAIRQMAHGGARFTAGGGPGGASAGAGFEDLFGGLFGQGGGGRVRFNTGGGGPQPDLEDILGGMFGGGAGRGYGGFGAPGGPRPGQDISARTSLSFRQATVGDTVTLQGADGQRITARIPAGVKDGQKIRLRGKGHQGDAGAPRGDMILTVHVEPHPVFGRDGNNLTVDLPVTFAEAALGTTVEVPTLSGHPVKVKVPAGTPSGRVLRLKGRGIQTKNGTGDLLAKVKIVVPQRLSDTAREAVQTLQAEEAGVDPRSELFARARE